MRFGVEMFGSLTLTAEEIWPDGDAPINPTTEDVAQRMRDFGKTSLMNDWMLADYLSISVTDNESKNEARVY